MAVIDIPLVKHPNLLWTFDLPTGEAAKGVAKLNYLDAAIQTINIALNAFEKYTRNDPNRQIAGIRFTRHPAIPDVGEEPRLELRCKSIGPCAKKLCRLADDWRLIGPGQ
uniref:Uncharacterized protein n=1 Tax=viral metagenome TaxID=1070528 RepID=A0A6H1ZH85_9ZZZZ